MERKEALRVLGLEEGATVEMARAAYRRLSAAYQELKGCAMTRELEREYEEELRKLRAAVEAVLPVGLPVWDEDLPGAGDRERAALLQQQGTTLTREYPILSPSDQNVSQNSLDVKAVEAVESDSDKKKQFSTEQWTPPPATAMPPAGSLLSWKAAALVMLVVVVFIAWLFFRDDGEEPAWQVAKTSSSREALLEFLQHYPKGKYAGAAKVKLKELKDMEPKESPSKNTSKGENSSSKSDLLPAKQENLQLGDVYEISLASNVKIKMVWIQPGTFNMGSMRGQPNEQPVHPVHISKGFWIGQCEVTQEQWEAIMGGNPSYFRNCPKCPVESVGWDDCQTFVKSLNEKHPPGGGLVWRLPTEAEWEYACRAGTTDEYNENCDLGELAWYAGNSTRTQPVAQKRPNRWGLYDMHGNVWEWCLDWYGERYSDRSRGGPEVDPRGPSASRLNQRILRGGAWDQDAFECRSADRRHNNPQARLSDDGLRLVIGTPF